MHASYYRWGCWRLEGCRCAAGSEGRVEIPIRFPVFQLFKIAVLPGAAGDPSDSGDDWVTTLILGREADVDFFVMAMTLNEAEDLVDGGSRSR